MKIRHLVLTGVLTVTMAVSPVFAAETDTEAPADSEAVTEDAAGDQTEEAEAPADSKDQTSKLLEGLFGEGGVLEGVLPEGTDVNELIGEIQEQQAEVTEGINSTLGEISAVIGAAQSEAAAIGEGAMEDITDAILDNYLGFSDFDESAFDELLRIVESTRGAEEQYIKERNAEMMDPGEVQIITNGCIYSDDYEADDIRIMSNIIQNNYKLNEENQLVVVSAAEDVILFRHQKDENGEYPVVDATFAEDGEGYADSIKAMCDELGISFDECMEDIEFNELCVLADLRTYLEEHPEVKGVEIGGEIKSYEEVDAMWNAGLDEMFAEEGEGAEAAEEDSQEDEAVIEEIPDEEAAVEAAPSEETAEDAGEEVTEEAPADETSAETAEEAAAEETNAA